MGRASCYPSALDTPLAKAAEGGQRSLRGKTGRTLASSLSSCAWRPTVTRGTSELATVSADAAPVTHPIDHEDTVVIAPGEKSEVDIDLRSSGPEEGWKRVHYRLSVVGTF